MPKISGLELLQRVRRSRLLAERPVIMLTARSNVGDIGVVIENGCTNYLIKPCRPLELKARIDSAMSQIPLEEPTKIPSRSTVNTDSRTPL